MVHQDTETCRLTYLLGTTERNGDNRQRQDPHCCQRAAVFHTAESPVTRRSATGWTVRGSNPAEGNIFCTRADRLLEKLTGFAANQEIPRIL